MVYHVKFTTRAQKDLRGLPRQVQDRILDSLELVRLNPFAEILQFKKLKARTNLYRIRIGDYRVIYEIQADRLIIIVIRIGHRKDVYRYLKA